MSLKSLIRTMDFRGRGLVVEFCSTQLEEGMADNPMVLEYLQGVLQQYTSIFSMPDSLPLDRSRDHQIVLKLGVEPLNI